MVCVSSLVIMRALARRATALVLLAAAVPGLAFAQADERVETPEMETFREEVDAAQKASRERGRRMTKEDQQQLFELIEERGGPKAIYGPDDRQDFHKFKFDAAVRTRAAASVALFSQAAMSKGAENTLKLKSKSLMSEYNLCPNENFAHQLSTAYCSGVLVKSDVVATAAHCVKEAHFDPDRPAPELKDIRFVFGYVATSDSDPGLSDIPAASVFSASTLLNFKFDAETGEDWAVVKLKDAVPASIATPVTPIASTKIAKNADVYVLGYPNGLPIKFAPGAKVRTNTATNYFVANLDTFGGNSGSGIFERQTHRLVGLLVRGDTDYVQADHEDCARTFPCPTTGCMGEHVMRIELVTLP